MKSKNDFLDSLIDFFLDLAVPFFAILMIIIIGIWIVFFDPGYCEDDIDHLDSLRK